MREIHIVITLLVWCSCILCVLLILLRYLFLQCSFIFQSSHPLGTHLVRKPHLVRQHHIVTISCYVYHSFILWGKILSFGSPLGIIWFCRHGSSATSGGVRDKGSMWGICEWVATFFPQATILIVECQAAFGYLVSHFISEMWVSKLHLFWKRQFELK